MLPDFIVAGASRSGTTTLHRALKRHPSIYLPEKKELHFFNRDNHFKKGAKYYEKSFRGARSGQIAGEISPPYFHRGITQDEKGRHRWSPQEDSASRAAGLVPNAKIIFTLRNPLERAFSQYAKNVAEGKEYASCFEEAIQLELSGERTPDNSQSCWLYKNLYSKHITHWRSFFPDEQIFLCIFEEWTQDPDPTFDAIYRFLGVDPIPLTTKDLEVANSTKERESGGIRGLLRKDKLKGWLRGAPTRSNIKPEQLSPETHHRALQYFREDIAAVERDLGRTIEAWKAN